MYHLLTCDADPAFADLSESERIGRLYGEKIQIERVRLDLAQGRFVLESPMHRNLINLSLSRGTIYHRIVEIDRIERQHGSLSSPLAPDSMLMAMHAAAAGQIIVGPVMMPSSPEFALAQGQMNDLKAAKGHVDYALGMIQQGWYAQSAHDITCGITTAHALFFAKGLGQKLQGLHDHCAKRGIPANLACDLGWDWTQLTWVYTLLCMQPRQDLSPAAAALGGALKKIARLVGVDPREFDAESQRVSATIPFPTQSAAPVQMASAMPLVSHPSDMRPQQTSSHVTFPPQVTAASFFPATAPAPAPMPAAPPVPASSGQFGTFGPPPVQTPVATSSSAAAPASPLGTFGPPAASAPVASPAPAAGNLFGTFGPPLATTSAAPAANAPAAGKLYGTFDFTLGKSPAIAISSQTPATPNPAPDVSSASAPAPAASTPTTSSFMDRYAEKLLASAGKGLGKRCPHLFS